MTQKTFQIEPFVFWGALVLIFSFLLLAMLNPIGSNQLFSQIQQALADHFGWFYISSVAFFLIFSLWLIVSPYGKLKLGSVNSTPEFSFWTWIAMLFSAGMGIGLMFYSVAEPILHFSHPPAGTHVLAGTSDAAEIAMNITFFHWGLHAWGIFAVTGLAIAFFCYRKNKPLCFRYCFGPLFGSRIEGLLGHCIDILAIVSTLFGIATSLGLGVMQINAGLKHLFSVSQGIGIQVALIVIITLIATISVVSGVSGGIRRLSELNVLLGAILLLFVFLAGPTVHILDSFVQNLGIYLQNLPQLTFMTHASDSSSWKSEWTIFYWGWWISWAPFVGIFIARISKGRSIREFVAGVLFVPTLLTFFWLTVFGNTALNFSLAGDNGIVEMVNQNLPVALFTLLERLPFATWTSILATLLVITFFVTSSDSGSLVVDILASGGNPNPPIPQRIFWATLEGLIAAILLVFGGLKALQTAAITSALFFAVILILMTFSLWKGIKQEL